MKRLSLSCSIRELQSSLFAMSILEFKKKETNMSATRTNSGISFSFTEEEIEKIKNGTLSDIECIVFELEKLEIGFITDNQCINNYETGAVLYDAYTDKVFLLNFSDINDILMKGETLTLEGKEPTEDDRCNIENN